MKINRWIILWVSILSFGTLTTYGQVIQIFPQFANGRIRDGSFRSSFLLTNNANSNITGAIEIRRSNGAELIVGFTNGQQGSRIPFSLAPGATELIESDGEGDLAAGFAWIDASGAVSASLIFSQLDAAGMPVLETGVCSPPALDSFTIPVDTMRGFNTGVAIVNAGNHTANVSLRLINATGTPMGNPVILTLEPKRHIARFVSELFPEIPPLRGSIAISSNADVYAVALRLSHKTLTAFPVSAGAFQAEFTIESGHYAGNTEDGGTVAFDVVNGNTLRNLKLNSPRLDLENGDTIAITNHRFSFGVSIPFASLTLSGTFTSANHASGTLVLRTESATDRINWSARRSEE
jgi:hypothetical protein